MQPLSYFERLIMNSYEALPDDLPKPVDDGACDHLIGMELPRLSLLATDGSLINLSSLAKKVVIYCYPMTGKPGVPLPDGWDEIPGARGCTPQTCSYRDHHKELNSLGASVFGLSTQSTDYQQEMTDRLQLPFLILSDDAFKFSESLNLPTFTVNKMRLIKRVTIIAIDGIIRHVHYPVFPSDADAAWVFGRLSEV